MPREEYEFLYSIFSNNVHYTLSGIRSAKCNNYELINSIDILTLAVDTASVCLEAIIELINEYHKDESKGNPLFNVCGLNGSVTKIDLLTWATTKVENL